MEATKWHWPLITTKLHGKDTLQDYGPKDTWKGLTVVVVIFAVDQITGWSRYNYIFNMIAHPNNDEW